MFFTFNDAANFKSSVGSRDVTRSRCARQQPAGLDSSEESQKAASTVEQKRWAESDRCVWATDYHTQRERESGDLKCPSNEAHTHTADRCVNRCSSFYKHTSVLVQNVSH